MKRIAITTLTALAFLASATAQTQNERIPARGFAVFTAQDTYHPYVFTRHAVSDNDIRIEILTPASATATCTLHGTSSRSRDCTPPIRWFRGTRSPDG